MSIISVREILNKNYPDQQFLIGPQLLPRGGKMVLTGENGTGKSVLLLHLSACLAAGTPFLGFVSRKKDTLNQPSFPVIGSNRVLYIDYEVPHAVRKTLRLLPLIQSFTPEQQDLIADNVHFIERPTKTRLDPEADHAMLQQAVFGFKPDVLIIDPLSSSHNKDENSPEMRLVFNQADKLIDDHGCAVVIAHHTTTKVLRDRAGHKIERGGKERSRGHSSITDWCDFNLVLTDRTPNEEGDDKKVKLLELDFAKTRYSFGLHKRWVITEIASMSFVPLNGVRDLGEANKSFVRYQIGQFPQPA